MSAGPIQTHVIADSTGDTAARVARAAQAQFATHPTRIVRHPRVTTAAGMATAFERITDGQGSGVAVFSTLVDDGLRALVVQRCDQLNIPHCDLLGPALDVLERASGDRAERIPARPVGIDSDYFKRIAAMEFVVKHDDGQYLEGLRQADIVLVGVSRTGKTPLSMYLGYLGYRTANVPLVPGIPPPGLLFEIDRWKVVALTIDPQRLARIRTRRVQAIGTTGDAGGYSALAAIFDELDQATRIQRRLGCPVIDTTNLALEEAAGRVIDLVDERRLAAPSARPEPPQNQGRPA
jgi:regulator of PEP synthase PpsR (kinase-PPPase family)